MKKQPMAWEVEDPSFAVCLHMLFASVVCFFLGGDQLERGEKVGEFLSILVVSSATAIKIEAKLSVWLCVCKNCLQTRVLDLPPSRGGCLKSEEQSHRNTIPSTLQYFPALPMSTFSPQLVLIEVNKYNLQCNLEFLLWKSLCQVKTVKYSLNQRFPKIALTCSCFLDPDKDSETPISHDVIIWN